MNPPDPVETAQVIGKGKEVATREGISKRFAGNYIQRPDKTDIRKKSERERRPCRCQKHSGKYEIKTIPAKGKIVRPERPSYI
jgi:hypothetical protein